MLGLVVDQLVAVGAEQNQVCHSRLQFGDGLIAAGPAGAAGDNVTLLAVSEGRPLERLGHDIASQIAQRLPARPREPCGSSRSPPGARKQAPGPDIGVGGRADFRTTPYD